MGVAILWLVAFHFGFPRDNFISHVFSWIIGMGQMGVDMFMFLSGIGMVFSIQKCPSFSSFFKRRFMRITKTYWPALVLIFLISFVLKNLCAHFTDCFTLSEIFYAGFFLDVLTLGNMGAYWFVSAIMVFYMLFPLLYLLGEKIGSLFVFWIALLVSIYITILFYKYDIHWQFMSARFPIFVLGYYMGYSYKMKKVECFGLVKSVIWFVSGLIIYSVFSLCYQEYMVSLGLHYWPWILMAPAMCYFIAYMIALLSKGKSIGINAIAIIGGATLEMYIVDATRLGRWLGYGVQEYFGAVLGMIVDIIIVLFLGLNLKWIINYAYRLFSRIIK